MIPGRRNVILEKAYGAHMEPEEAEPEQKMMDYTAQAGNGTNK